MMQSRSGGHARRQVGAFPYARHRGGAEVDGAPRHLMHNLAAVAAAEISLTLRAAFHALHGISLNQTNTCLMMQLSASRKRMERCDLCPYVGRMKVLLKVKENEETS